MSFVDFKEVANVDAGDTIHYGSDQLLEVLKIFNGKTVLNRRINIKNPWRFSDRIEMASPISLPSPPTSNTYVHLVIDPLDFHLKVQRNTGVLTDLETFSLDTNALSYSTSANNVAGDILKNDGTKYNRFARGSNGQVLLSTSGDIQWGQIADANVSSSAAIGWTKINKANSKLSDLADTNLPTPTNGQVPTWSAATSRWINQTPPGSSVGEANTASNQGIGGVGPFIAKSGVDLQFKNVNAGSSKVTITNDTTNREIDIDVVEANLSLPNIGGTLSNAQTPTTPSGKTLNIDTNTLQHSTTNAAGDILIYDTTSTKYIRLPRGATNQVLTSTASTIQWSTPSTSVNIRGGRFISQGDNATTVFNIAHGAGVIPTSFSITPGSPSTINNQAGASNRYWATADVTNIIVTYAGAPPTGTQNVQWQWIVIF